MEEEKKIKKGDNPKGQGPSKPKKEKTKEEKEVQRAKQAEKKRLKKEQARLEEEKKKKELEGNQNEPKEEDKKDNNNEEDKKEDKKENKKEGKKGDKKEKGGKGGKGGKDGKDGKENENISNNIKEQKDNKKKRFQFYGITSFEERNEELKISYEKKEEESNNSILSTNEIMNRLSKKVKYSKVNEEIINSIRNIFLCGSTKQTKNCLNLLNSIKLFVDSVEGDTFHICDEVRDLIKNVNLLIRDISEKCSGLFNTCKFLQQVAEVISSYPPNISKKTINTFIQYFIDSRIKKIDNNNTIMKDLIQDGDTILLYGKSKIFRKLFINAKENKIKFKIIFADSPQRSQISDEIKFLSNLDIPVKYTYIKGVNNLMSEVTKVFIKGDSMLKNGDLMGRQGTSILAFIAKTFNKSVYVFCPSFKFMDKIIISNNPKIIKNNEIKCNEMAFDYNITPSNFIKTVICENGYIHASSISVYIRELDNNDNKNINSALKNN